MNDYKELIEEARDMTLYARTTKHGAVSHADMIDDLADALEASLAARQPSEDGEYILKLIETIKETGGSVEIHGVKILPCDEFGRTAAVPDAATEARIERWMQLVGKGVEERMAAEAERDAALAAIERVRAVLAEERAWLEHLGESSDAYQRAVIRIGKVEAALDGAPEPEVKP